MAKRKKGSAPERQKQQQQSTRLGAPPWRDRPQQQPAPQERPTVTCKSCSRWLYQDRLKAVGFKCLCGCSFPGQQLQQQPKLKKNDREERPLPSQAIALMTQLAKEEGKPEIQAAAKSYLEAAKKASPAKPPSEASSFQQATAKVTKAEQAFERAKRNKCRLILELEEAEKKLTESMTELAAAELQKREFVSRMAAASKTPLKQTTAAEFLAPDFSFTFDANEIAKVADKDLNSEDRTKYMEELKCLQDDLNASFHQAMAPVKQALKDIQTQKNKEFAEIFQRVTGKKMRTPNGAAPAQGGPAPGGADGDINMGENPSSQVIPTPESAPVTDTPASTEAAERVRKKVEEDTKAAMEEAIRSKQQERGCPSRSG